MSEPIFERIEHDLGRILHHHQPAQPYHDPEPTPATAAPEAPPMSLISTLEEDFAEVRTKVEEFAESKLPAALGDVKKLEGNPVVDALLSATHVPASALNGVVSVIQALADAFPKDDRGGVEVEPDPADVPSVPQPAAAGPVVGGQA